MSGKSKVRPRDRDRAKTTKQPTNTQMGQRQQSTETKPQKTPQSLFSQMIMIGTKRRRPSAINGWDPDYSTDKDGRAELRTVEVLINGVGKEMLEGSAASAFMLRVGDLPHIAMMEGNGTLPIQHEQRIETAAPE